MHVVITGGAGFLGQRLAKALLERGTLRGARGGQERIEQLTLVDVGTSPLSDPRIRHVAGDLADPATLDRVIDRDTTSIFHLAAVVSGQAEADLDLGLRVNLDASRRLFDRCGLLGHRPRLVFTSSVAVYGGALAEGASEATAPNPQTSYGTQKAMAELLLDDYSRRGLVDGRSLRLPTIVVRPGKPNAAASSFASGIIREPLNGQPSVCPVPPETVMWVLSPPTVVDAFIHAHELAAEAFGTSRIVNVPGLSVSVREMADALERVAGREVGQRVEWKEDPAICRIAATWPGTLNASRALGLGFRADSDFDDIIRQYMRDELGAPRAEATSR
ncbi:MAG: SDR family oxidoreductase [Acidobacteria bacterium]|nr:SDR family oxidoreductase [Acidobacteriota bacterium]